MAPISTSIYAEYFGVSSKHMVFGDVPNKNKDSPFHFNIAFAVDSDGKGKFTAQWAPKIDADMVTAYKTSHPLNESESQTSFFLSIGWNDDTKYTFTGADGWTENATDSIRDIIRKNNFDGIDIHFSSIDKSVSQDQFVKQVGGLIKNLKDGNVIHVASITPTPALEDYYKGLYDNSKDIIDFVNYRFYDLKPSPTNESQFIDAINAVKSKYQSAILLVGNKTSDGDGKIQDVVFFDSYQQVTGLHGIFGWSADDSSDKFPFEDQAQTKLVPKK